MHGFMVVDSPKKPMQHGVPADEKRLNSQATTPARVRSVSALCAALAATSFVFSVAVPASHASSHREAPLISEDPAADATDLYAFRTPQNASDGGVLPNSLIIIANYWPMQEPGSGPNWPRFSDGVLYEIKIDNDGDAIEDITYQFRFRTEYLKPDSVLLASAPVAARDAAALQVRQRYTVTRLERGGAALTLLRDQLTPPVYAGTYTLGAAAAYEALAQTTVYPLGGDVSNNGRVFAGQRDDAFYADLGSVFDLLRARCQATPNSPAGCGSSGTVRGVDFLAGYNVHTIAIQVPITRLLRSNASVSGKDQVLGIWTTASRPRVTIRRAPPLTAATRIKTQDATGSWVQVSRLGLPLVNELLVPLAYKDTFNTLAPSQDALLFASPDGNSMLSSPEVAGLLQRLYGIAVPPAGRTDLNDLLQFHIAPGGTGSALSPFRGKEHGLALADILRIDVSTPAASDLVSNRLGALGVVGGTSDPSIGFPNGRRPQDDVIDIVQRVLGGTLRGVSAANSLGDGVDGNDKPFLTQFPYLSTPWSGSEVNTSTPYRQLHTAP